MEVVSPWFLYFLRRNAIDIVLFSGVILVQAIAIFWVLRGPAAEATRRVRQAVLAGGALSIALIAFGFLLNFSRVARYFPSTTTAWVRGGIIGWALISVLIAVMYGVSGLLPRAESIHSPARRRFLQVAKATMLAAPAITVGYGVFIERTDLRLREERIPIPALHPDLDGLRIVQLTDIHLSSFLPESVLARAVDMANETKAHIALVTGDLISFQGDPLDTCLKHLARLRGEAGAFGCLGNHEIYAQTEDYTTEAAARFGMRFLRREAALLKFGAAELNLGGVDYQHLGGPYLVGADKLIRPGALNLMLSHNPDVFPVAAEQGWDVTLAGHTHGGQVTIELLHQNMSIARFFTHYIDGLYRSGSSSIFVSRGIGTIGLPARLGVPPEVALVTLCRI